MRYPTILMVASVLAIGGIAILMSKYDAPRGPDAKYENRMDTITSMETLLVYVKTAQISILGFMLPLATFLWVLIFIGVLVLFLHNIGTGHHITGILSSGSIQSNQMTVVTVVGDHNTVTQTTTSQKPPLKRIEYNVEDCVNSFKGRESILASLHETIRENQRTGTVTVISQAMIISGMGGVGKTETVRRYIQLYKNEYGHILWINAENYSEARSSFLILSRRIKVSIQDPEGRLKGDRVIADEVYDELCEDRCLIIFDNAQPAEDGGDDDVCDTFFPKTNKRNWLHPAVIITTRFGAWNQATLIHLKGLEATEVYSLLISQLHFEENEENIELAYEIGALCEGLPLVVQQAIAVILDKNESQMSFGHQPYQMQEFLEEVQDDATTWIHKIPADPRVGKSVYRIFEMTFKQLHGKTNGKIALKCLDIMAKLHPDKIPMKLLECLLLTIDGVSERQLKDCMRLLIKINLVERFDGYYKVHRMIQAVRLEYAASEGTIFEEKVYQSFRDIVNKEPTKSWELNDILCNGARLAVTTADKYRTEKVFIEFVDATAFRLADIGYHSVAEILYRSNLGNATAAFGNFHHETFKIKYDLATLLSDQGKYEEASALLKEIISSASQIDEDNLHALKAKRKLAVVLCKQGKPDAAMELYKKVGNKEQKIKLDPNDDDMIETGSILAMVLRDQGKYSDAVEVYDDILQRCQQRHGEFHRYTMEIKNNLALVLDDIGEYGVAATFYLQILPHQQQHFGFTHPFTVTTLVNLAGSLSNLGYDSEAADIHREVLKHRETVLGSNHPETLTSKHNLANCLVSQENLEEAADLLEEVSKEKEEVLGRHHPETLMSKTSLAAVHLKQGRLDKAAELLQDTLLKQQKTLGQNHPSTLVTRGFWASVLLKQGDSCKAVDLLLSVIAERKKLLGESHPLTITTKSSLAEAYYKQQRLAEAAQLYDEVLQQQLVRPGISHPDTISTKELLAQVYCKQRNYHQAVQLYQDVLHYLRATLSHGHPDLSATRKDLAAIMLHLRLPCFQAPTVRCWFDRVPWASEFVAHWLVRDSGI